jgi:uridine monophosphate synthetase
MSEAGSGGFFTRLSNTARATNSLLCVGIDPPLDGVPDALEFGRRILDSTRDAACVYKPNSAFFEARGPKGLEAMRTLIHEIHSAGLPVILDAKRGDISSTADAYAKAAFDVMEADAITFNPLLGGDSAKSFTSRADKGVFVLCHTSNPGSRELQELDAGGIPLYLRIAALALSWNENRNVGLVAGATFPEVLARVRDAAFGMWILLPGVGSQGGDLESSLSAGLSDGGDGVIVNVSRGISGASDPKKAALEYRDRINRAREKRPAARSEKTAADAGPPPAGRSRVSRALIDSLALGLHKAGAVKFGEFILKSGMKSPIYVDLRLLVSDPDLMRIAARAISGLISGLRYDRIAAIPYGGLPIGQAVSLETGRPLIYPRKEVKAHGTKNSIEGNFTSGETVVVLDDLITTGGSKLEAMEPLREAGLKVKDIVVLIDREQGGVKELAGRGIALHSVATLSEILSALVRCGIISEETRRTVRSELGIS